MNMFQPENITKKHILDAVEKIEREGKKLNKSRKYLVEINGKQYPPKEILRTAHIEMVGYPPNDDEINGGEETNKYFKKHGFKIINIDKKENNLMEELSKLVSTKKTLQPMNKLQEHYNQFKRQHYEEIKTWDWYLKIQKLSSIIEIIRNNIDSFSNYEMLNTAFQKEIGRKDDFLNQYLFISNNGLSIIRQQLITHYTRDRLWNNVKTESGYQKFVNIIKAQTAIDAFQQVHAWVGENTYTVFHRFVRALFPKQYTVIDAPTRLYNLLQKLKTDFNIDIDVKTNHPVELQKQITQYIDDEDYPFKQIFFWEYLYAQENEKENSMNQEYQKHPLNQILFGPPGTGKTYNSIIKAVKIANPNFILDVDWQDIKTEFNRLVESKQIVFTTFHQSMNYEDFIEGIKPQEPKGEESISYKVEDGIFKQLCIQAQKRSHINIKLENHETELSKEIFENLYKQYFEQLPDQKESSSPFQLETKTDKSPFWLYKNSSSIVVKAGNKQTPMSLSCNELLKVLFDSKDPLYKSYEDIVITQILNQVEWNEVNQNNFQKPHVIIIDEINRGNVSAIFGELITLIEESKRLGNKEELKVKLPYSKKLFGVPSNIHIIGTMNTADRSVEALDTALRRRFTFTEMPPISELIEENAQKGKLKIGENIIDLKKILDVINQRIEILLDKDHLIGHSFFINVVTIEDLKQAFSKQIIPLLQEYFYGDYGKISLVLGEGFCQGKSAEKNNIFAYSTYYEADNYSDKIIYKIIDPISMDENNTHNSTFSNAIQKLLNQNTNA